MTALSQDVTVTQPAAKAEKIQLAFQLYDWHAKHFDDPAQAAEHAKVLKQLQCEVATVQHNGHTDVRCRTIVWKSLALDSVEQVQQWQAWLNAAGFETLYGRKPQKGVKSNGQPHQEIVQYRLTDWKSQHAHQASQMGQYKAIYSALGCETQEVDHGNHKDLRIRCPDWLELELPTHEAAHKWQKFLQDAGFETAHEH
ncbi:MAG: hypothetical protein R3C53_22375 [Pirellulaceae bacterium]